MHVIKRDGPVACLWRGSANHDIAASIKPAPGVIRSGQKRNAITGSDRQFTAARDSSARVRIDVARSGFRPSGPGSQRDRAKRDAAAQRRARRAETDNRGNKEGKNGTEQ